MQPHQPSLPVQRQPLLFLPAPLLWCCHRAPLAHVQCHPVRAPCLHQLQIGDVSVSLRSLGVGSLVEGVGHAPGLALPGHIGFRSGLFAELLLGRQSRLRERRRSLASLTHGCRESISQLGLYPMTRSVMDEMRSR